MQDLHPDILREIVRRVGARNRVALEATSRTMRGAARPVALEVTRATLAGLCRAVKIAVRLNDYFQQKYSVQKMRIWRPFAREVEADLRAYAAALQSAARPGEGAELSFVMTTDVELEFEVHDLFVGTVNGIRITMSAYMHRGEYGRPLMHLEVVNLPSRSWSEYITLREGVVTLTSLGRDSTHHKHRAALKAAARAIQACVSAR